MKTQKYFAVALATASMFGSAHAVVFSWTGAVNGDWNNAGNWGGTGMPVDSLAGGNLELASATDDRIQFNVFGANPVPTSNIPTLGGSASGNPRPNVHLNSTY